jgi:hypothetical protein
MRIWIFTGWVSLSLLALGCSGDTGPAPIGGGSVTVIEKEDPPVIDHPPIDLPPESRSTKRLTIDMLANSLPVVAGKNTDGEDITWKVKAFGQLYEALDQKVLGGTLGKPDYVSTTMEYTDPSMLYLKFMDDMARDVCMQMTIADQARTDAEDRVLVPLSTLDKVGDEASIYANLRYLKLRFHGVKVADDDTESIALLKTLFDTVAETTSGDTEARAREAWRTVCVGLFLSPEFHVY